MNRIAEIGLQKFLLKHEREIEKAGKFNDQDEWSLLYLAFWQVFGRRAGEPVK